MASKHPGRTRIEGFDEQSGGVESAPARDVLAPRAGLANTLPPTRLEELLSMGGAALYVLSVDQELIETVRRASSERCPVYAVEDWAELEIAVETGRCAIALLDAGLLGRRISSHVADLEPYTDQLVTLVAADREAAQDLMGLLSDRKIHRLLIKPPALGTTRLLLESAFSRWVQLRERVSEQAAVHGEGRPRPLPARVARIPAWVLATALASLVVGVAVVSSMSSLWRPETPAAAAEPTVQSPSMGASLGEQLRRADLAFAQGRMAEPPGDNALDYYLTVLAVQPTHSLARDRLAIVVEGLFSQAEEALLTSSFERADAVLSSVRRADPTSSRLGFLDAQLQRARAAASPVAGGVGGAGRSVSLGAAPPAATPDVIVAPALGGSEPAELESLLTIAAARVRRGQLIEPVGDSAYEYVERAARLSPTDPRVVAARAQIAAQLVAAARVGLAVADVATAEDLLDEARRLGADPERLTVLDLEVASARAAQARQREAALLTALRQRLLSGALFDPLDDSALYYLETLQNQGSVVAGLAAARAELVTTLASNARAALERRDWVAAQAGLDGLARARGDPATVQRLEQQLETARLQEQYLAVAAPANELRLLDFAQPVYPPDAVQRGVQGWVELEFVIDREGRLRDIATVAAEPAGRFEQAALAAVRQYRYAPFQLQGHTYERRARLRIRFTLE